MKTILWTKYGGPESLELSEQDKPEPNSNEILIKIYATTVTAGDCEMRGLKFPFYLRFPLRLFAGLKRPKRITVLGQELAGIIEAVGAEVKDFSPGDHIFAATDVTMGAYAEYLCLKKGNLIARKPMNVSFEAAAAIPVGGLNAWFFLKKAKIQSGQKILINGAGGSIGTIAVQIAKHFGAEVTAVDSTEKLEMLRSIGADHQIDYTQEDFWRTGKKFDVILDLVVRNSFSGCMKSLTKSGVYVMGNPKIRRALWGALRSLVSRKKVLGGTASYTVEDLHFLTQLVETGKITPVIDRIYPMDQIVKAHTYVESGQKKGNVIIQIHQTDS